MCEISESHYQLNCSKLYHGHCVSCCFWFFKCFNICDFTFFQYYKMTVLVYMSHDIALLELCHQSYCLSFLGDVCE